MGLTFNLGRVSPSVFTDSSLNVGIGGSPSGTYKLEVTGSVRILKDGEALRISGDSGYIGFFNTANSTRSGYLQGNTTSLQLASSLAIPILFLTSDAEKMRITSAGNVGIGTTNPSSISSGAINLIVKGISGLPLGYIQASSYDGLCSLALYSGTTSADNPALIFQNSLRFGTTTDLATTGYAERMRITSGGDVGIGTSTIYYASSGRRALEINGTTNSFLAFKVSDTAKSYLFQNGTDFIITNLAAAGGALVLENNGAERMRISSAGHVTIPYQPYFKYGVAYTGTITSATRFGTNYGFTVNTDRDAVDSSHFNKATGLFTAPVAGVYMFGCTIMRSGTSGIGPIDFWICKNPQSLTTRTNSYGRGYADSYSTAYQQFTIVVPIKLAVSDTVALGMGGNMTIYNDDSWFYGYLLG